MGMTRLIRSDHPRYYFGKFSDALRLWSCFFLHSLALKIQDRSL
jgi:hypothetical protein